MKIENIIENKIFDEERALYNLKNTEVKNCVSRIVAMSFCEPRS